MKNKIKTMVKIFILLFFSICIVGSNYFVNNFRDQSFEEIIFHLISGVGGTSSSVVFDIIKKCFVLICIITIVLYFLQSNNFFKTNKYLKVKIKGKEKKICIYPIKFIQKYKKLFFFLLEIIAIICVVKSFKIDNYLKNQFQRTKIFDEYYMQGENVNITFPEEKRNLIIIFTESMEASLASKENGGGWEYSIIPELEKLALENMNFSNTEEIGGAKSVSGTTFTAAGLVAHTSGVPIKVPLADYNQYVGTGKYLDKVYSLGEILKSQGYNLEIMMGSDGEFGGRTQYFTTNGNYKIFDLNYAIQQGKMTKEETVWWGFEDDKLFEWSKEEILNLAEQDKPFNYIMLTADTHFIDGYLSNNAEKKFDQKYENVFAYSSKSIYEFVQWIQEQDFYQDTTVVILGDHLGMQTQFYEEHLDSNYERTIYNVFINSAIEEQNSKNRIFTTMDMYPTILASIGAKIEGEKIGLGTNLFSGEKTLSERLGHEYLNQELNKKSNFYNKNILGDDYTIMVESEKN